MALQGVQFRCPDGQHNDLATAFYTTDDNLLDRWFSVGQDFDKASPESTATAGFTHASLGMYSGVYLIMMALASGICVPAGLFMPAIMLGASMGLNVGLGLQAWLPHWHIQPGARRRHALLCECLPACLLLARARNVMRAYLA